MGRPRSHTGAWKERRMGTRRGDAWQMTVSEPEIGWCASGVRSGGVHRRVISIGGGSMCGRPEYISLYLRSVPVWYVVIVGSIWRRHRCRSSGRTPYGRSGGKRDIGRGPLNLAQRAFPSSTMQAHQRHLLKLSVLVCAVKNRGNIPLCS